jgi:DNA-binding CsgD family transcriptional regulator/catechol 2,3-dioxygenase-like lactoylglutathione lyase family enzyme
MASRRRGRPPHPDVLTPAEWAILDWVRHGLSRREMARLRGVSLSAVRYHLANISGKLGVAGVRELRHWSGVPATRPRLRPVTPRKENALVPNPGDLPLGRLGQVALSVRDVPRAEAFYATTLGLPHLFTFGDLAFFDMAGTRLYLQRMDDADWRPGSLLYFVVEDIHAAVAALEGRGVAFRGASHRIHTHDDGTEEWMAFFDDPDGNVLALMARVSSAA